MKLPIYNLVFRPYSHRLQVRDYVFERVQNYPEQYRKLQHLVTSHGSEFSTTINTGEHAHTANVTGPDSVIPSIIPWQHYSPTALDDIILLLKLFTNRDVFSLNIPDDQKDEPFALRADPRIFPWGGTLACSIPYESKQDDMDFKREDISLSVHLPKIYELIRTEEWQAAYKCGYFLVLLSEAIKQRTLEAAFGQCWSIWEHLFACLTDSWMSKNTTWQISSKEKIAFLLVKFAVRVNLEDTEKSRLEDLVAIRNRLIHFGQFPERNAVRSDATMFIHITEYIAAKALGLFPSNVFNTIEHLEEFLANDSKRGI